MTTPYRNMSDGPGYFRTAPMLPTDLWQSRSENALLLPGFNMSPGFGPLKGGTILAKNQSTAGNRNQHVPYCPNDYTGVASDSELMVGRTFLTSDGAATATTVNVLLKDSYRFVVGDDLIIGDNTTPPENLGAITDIDRESSRAVATITFTTAIGATAFTVANYANVHVMCGTATPWMDAQAVLAQDVESGEGEVPQGQMPATAVVRGNVALKKKAVRNSDAASLTALGARFVNDSFFVM